MLRALWAGIQSKKRRNIVFPSGRAREAYRGRHVEGLLRPECCQRLAMGTGRPANWVTRHPAEREGEPLNLQRAENISDRGSPGQMGGFWAVDPIPC